MASLWVLASLGGLKTFLDWATDVPRFQVTPVALWLGVGKDIDGSPLVHEVTLVMPCMIFNSGKRKLNPLDYLISVKLKDGKWIDLPSVRTPKDVFEIIKSKANLKDVFSGLNDLTQDITPIDADSTKYGYICFHGKGVSFETLDEMTDLEAEVQCSNAGTGTFKSRIVVNNIGS